MQRFKRLIFLILSFGFIIACSEQHKNALSDCGVSDKQEINLKYLKQLEIDIPSEVNYDFSQENFVEKNNQLLYWGFDNANRELFICTAENKSINRILKFGNEGKNELPGAHYSIYLHNLDSIFLVADYPLRLYISDSLGNIFYRKKLDKILYQEKGEFGTYFFRDLKALFQERKHLLHIYYIQLYELPHNPEIQYKQPLEAVIDYKKTKLVSLFGKYPYAYTHDLSVWYPNLHYSSHCIFNDSLTVLSLGASSKLQIYNHFTGRKIKEVCCKSRFLKEIQPISIHKTEQQEITNFENTSGYYRNILYDPYRKLFLRIVKHKQDLRNQYGTLNQFLDSPWSIIWLNTQFQIIGEKLFEGKKYDFRKISIIPKGILIYKNTNNENKITYDLFKIERKI